MCHECAGASVPQTPESIEIFSEGAIAPKRQCCSLAFERHHNCLNTLKRQHRRGLQLLQDNARSNAIDAVHLHELVEEKSFEIVVRRSYAESPPRVEYELTEKGDALKPIIDEMRRFGHDWLGCDVHSA